jgi:hypothetical protein
VHLVIAVSDVERSYEFYRHVFCWEPHLAV